MVKNPHAKKENGLDPWVGKIPGEGNGSSFKYSCLGNRIDRGAWRDTVHGVSKSRTWLSHSAAAGPPECKSPTFAKKVFASLSAFSTWSTVAWPRVTWFHQILHKSFRTLCLLQRECGRWSVGAKPWKSMRVRVCKVGAWLPYPHTVLLGKILCFSWALKET